MMAWLRETFTDAVRSALARHVVEVAANLATEQGGEPNPEYDRALVELAADIIGVPQDERAALEFMILGRTL